MGVYLYRAKCDGRDLFNEIDKKTREYYGIAGTSSKKKEEE